MTRLAAIARFIWEFVVGDDWRVAAGVITAIAVTAVIATTTLAAWWIIPLAVALLLATTVYQARQPH
ncbi:MAG TPA: hypothetical protein VHM72_07235 [Solirubrobacteraceae bacterium]|jgi:hypothetical protein|nr:hypothetical protein [Solirubrobacteraceae bacterium]